MQPLKILEEPTDVTVIAQGRGVRSRQSLAKAYGAGNWRKMKGIARVELASGRTCRAEIHWYEAHGIGRRDPKIKRILG
jgi:hypothetical protein